MIAMIWAMDENWLMGDNNLLPWHYPEDLAFFKKITENKTVLMGRKTYESLKHYYRDKPFPYQKNYVLSRNPDLKLPDATVITDLEPFLNELKEDLYVIGGSIVYDLMMPYADRLYITYILKRYQGQTYFKPFDLSQFKCVHQTMLPELIIATYERIPK